MHRIATMVVLAGLTACGPSGIASSVGDVESESQADDDSGDGDGDSGDGDGDSGDGDGDSGDGDGDSGDGESGDGDGDGEPDLPPIECEPLIDGNVVLDENSTAADFAALECVTQITGNLEISHTEAVDLSFLSSLVSVGGTVEINGNDALLDLAGLDALEHVGGPLFIYYNDGIESLAGLGSLHSMHGLLVKNNTSLVSVAGLSGDIHLHAFDESAADFVRIAINNNQDLKSLDGLADITSLTVELPLRIEIEDNEQLGGDLFGLSGFVSDEQQLSLQVTNNALDSLAGLEALTTAMNIHLLGPHGDFTSLAGLDNLTIVTETLRIGDCICVNGEVDSECDTDFGLELLESLDGLESLVEVGELIIWGNESLADISGLASLAHAGDVDISSNPLLPAMAVTNLLAGIEVTGAAFNQGNGTGNDPICGFIPQ